MSTNYGSTEHYKRFCINLQKAIKDTTGKIVSIDVLDEIVIDNLDRHDFEHGYALAGNVQPKDWHLVLLGLERNTMHERSDSITAAPSRVEALSYALSEMDTAMVVPDEVRSNNGTIEFLIKGKPMLRIEQVKFEPVDLAARHRVNTAFKGIRAYGDPRLYSALKSIPGLTNIEEEQRHELVRGECLIKTSANIALAIRELAKEVGVELKQHQAQDITAQVFGAKNWATFIAKEDELGSQVSPMILTDDEAYNDPTGKVGLAKIFRTEAEAIWAFGQRIKNYPEPLGYSFSSGFTNILGQAFPTGHDSFSDPDCVRFSVQGIFPAFGSDDMTLETRLLASLDVADALAKHLNITASSSDQKIAGIMKRRKVPDEMWRKIGGIIFSKVLVGGGIYHLFAETLDEKGRAQQAGNSATYKAEIAKLQSTDKYAVIGDYGRNIDIKLGALSDAEVQELSEFSGIGIQQHAFDDTEKKTANF